MKKKSKTDHNYGFFSFLLHKLSGIDCFFLKKRFYKDLSYLILVTHAKTHRFLYIEY